MSTEALHGDLSGDVLENNVFAGVFPEDKVDACEAFSGREQSWA